MFNVRTLEEKVIIVFDILSEIYKKSSWSQEQILNDMRQENVDYFFVSDNQKIVGFLSVQQMVGELEITNIAVSPSFQGKGMGIQLMSYLDNYDFPIFLEVRKSNKVAQALYEKFGFKLVGERKNYYHSPNEHALVMKREGKNK